jgi:hypothetical protein
MAFRFHRSFRILPGVRLNLSKSGLSASLGIRGAHVTVGAKGTRTSVGLPGTGLSYTSYSPFKRTEGAPMSAGLLAKPESEAVVQSAEVAAEHAQEEPAAWSGLKIFGVLFALSFFLSFVILGLASK